ncbi:MAG: peptidase M6, partial [Nitrososphaerales archaeon]
DFGFVQVSTDGGKTWTSLSNASTTSAHDVNAHPNIIANLPGLTGSTGGAWVPMSYDLSAYAGQDILIGLRYMTDWSTTEAGWFVDNVKVGDTLISDGTSTAAFKDLTEILPINNNFAVTFVGITGTGSGAAYKTLTLKLNHVSEEGLFELNKILKSSTSAMLLVTAEMPADFTRYVDYSYSFSFTDSGPKK